MFSSKLQQLIDYFPELILIVASTLLIRVWLKRRLRARGPLPPGPWGLPFVGYLPFLGKSPHIKLKQLSKKYGPIIGINTGSSYSLILNDYETTIEAFKKNEFNGRPENGFFMAPNLRHVADLNNRSWTDQRNFFDVNMRTFTKGENGTGIQKAIEEEVIELLAKMNDFIGTPSINLNTFGSQLAINVMAKFTFGKAFDFEGPVTTDQFHFYQASILAQGTIKAPGICFPWFASILRKYLSNMIKMNGIVKLVEHIVNKEIESHEELLDPNHPKDYIDHYLIHMKKTNDPLFSRNTLNGYIQAAIIGGTDALYAVLEWLLLLLTKHQDVQQKMYEEIVGQFGTEIIPNLDDKGLLPYSMATVHESMRFITIITLSSVRCTLADVTLRGYHIPKDTLVYSNTWAINNDVEYWKDPEVFRPERYLTKDGNFNQKERFLAFSFGKRKCPASISAIAQLVIVAASILQKFHLFPPEGGVSFQSVDNSLVNIPEKPFVRIERR